MPLVKNQEKKIDEQNQTIEEQNALLEEREKLIAERDKKLQELEAELKKVQTAILTPQQNKTKQDRQQTSAQSEGAQCRKFPAVVFCAQQRSGGCILFPQPDECAYQGYESD